MNLAAAAELLASVPNENPFVAGAAESKADALEEAADEVSTEAEFPNENPVPSADGLDVSCPNDDAEDPNEIWAAPDD